MVQLRMELTAAQEEVDFMRARQAKIHEEEHRLQMVAEMSKRLGTTVSKFELESLRNQVASLTKEAERVQKHNVQLQAEVHKQPTDAHAFEGLTLTLTLTLTPTQARKQATDAHAFERLQAEISAFQKANDNLEAEMLKREKHTEHLRGQVRAAHERIGLLQRQLALTHQGRPHNRSPTRSPPAGYYATSTAAPTAAPTASRDERRKELVGGVRRKLPLLWDEMASPSGAIGSGALS